LRNAGLIDTEKIISYLTEDKLRLCYEDWSVNGV